MRRPSRSWPGTSAAAPACASSPPTTTWPPAPRTTSGSRMRGQLEHRPRARCAAHGQPHPRVPRKTSKEVVLEDRVQFQSLASSSQAVLFRLRGSHLHHHGPEKPSGGHHPRPNWRPLWLNPCGEILGADFHCNLAEIHLNQIDPLTEPGPGRCLRRRGALGGLPAQPPLCGALPPESRLGSDRGGELHWPV
jgi:hypothetical protein